MKMKAVRTIWQDTSMRFLLLGGLIFLGYSWLQPQSYSHLDREIVIVPEYQDKLIEGFFHKSLRAPTDVETEALLKSAVMEEVLYREAELRGLDEGDEFIRRRMIKKMEYVIEGMVDVPQPSLDQLQAYLDENKHAFLLDEQFSFHHLFFSTAKRGASAKLDAQSFLTQLPTMDLAAAEVYKSGDPFLKLYHFKQVDKQQVRNDFGKRFAQQLAEVEANGSWVGPLESRFGFHLVYVESKGGGTLPKLYDIRHKVYAAWKRDQVELQQAKLEQELLTKYDVKLAKKGSHGHHAGHGAHAQNAASQVAVR